MTIKNLKPRVIVVSRPSKEVGEGASVFLIPGMNAIRDEDATWVAKAIKRRAERGEIVVLDGKADPFGGSLDDVVKAVGETFDRATLEGLRERDTRKKVREAVDAQLARLTDHRKAS